MHPEIAKTIDHALSHEFYLSLDIGKFCESSIYNDYPPGTLFFVKFVMVASDDIYFHFSTDRSETAQESLSSGTGCLMPIDEFVSVFEVVE